MTALLLIDVQLGLQETDYYGEERSNSNAENNCKIILEAFRKRNLPSISCSTLLHKP